MPRLFTGIEVPSAIRERLAFKRVPLPGAKWLDPDDLHLTLRFLGDVDSRTAGEFIDLISGLDLKPFQLKLRDLGTFGSSKPRILYVSVDEDPAITRAHQAHDRAARMVGLEPEPRTFKPHVTLARLRGTRPETVAQYLGELGQFRAEPFEVRRIVVFSSRPGTGGGPYVVEAAFPLDGAIGDGSW